MQSKDVVIIGAGITGLYLSRQLEKLNIDYITLEKRRILGAYGPRIINLETLKKLRLPKSKVVKPIRKINFYSPSGSKISKKDNKTRGVIVNLKDIENFLYNSIKDKSKVMFGCNVINFDLKKRIIKTDDDKKIRFRVLIFANGILGAKFRNKLGINQPKKVFCYAVEIKGREEISTIIDTDVAIGFYGWIIPLGNNKVEAGFGVEESDESDNRDKKEMCRQLFSLAHIKKYKAKKVFRVNGGFIPTSIIERKAGNNWLIVGDAAGGEPMLGGSIHKCIDESEIAIDILEEYLNKKRTSLKRYEIEWNNLFGEEFENQKKVRNTLNKTKNKDIDRIFHAIKEKRLAGKGLINDLFRNILKNLED